MPDDRASEWDERYRAADLPWDSGQPSEELQTIWSNFPELQSSRFALDIGCGTGTNAIWLAQQGLLVLGLDLAPKAIELARRKASAAGVTARFSAADFLSTLPSAPSTVDFAFDRGCFHCVEPEARPTFARQVHTLLRPGGWWLTLTGNTDGGALQAGPPQLTAAELVTALEPNFEIHHLRRFHFHSRLPTPPLAWSCLMRRRD